jgi:hypothetical protein
VCLAAGKAWISLGVHVRSCQWLFAGLV